MIKAVALTGPTASGKTSLSLSIAERFGMEILSCDSMQIYRRMDIGTAKATPAERARVPHHLLDIREPDERFSAQDYADEALAVAREVEMRGAHPLFVGGTGLYLDAVLRGSGETPPSSHDYRARFEAETKTEEGRKKLFERLTAVDPESAAATHENNVRRVLRALEIFDATGIPKSEWDRRSKERKSEFDVCCLTLDAHDRETLYRRADLRVERMLEDGLLDEVRTLYRDGFLPPDSTAAQAIGYKELLGVVGGGVSLAEAKEQLLIATRHYVKRQLTWFRGTPARVYIDTEDGKERSESEIFSDAERLILQHFPEFL